MQNDPMKSCEAPASQMHFTFSDQHNNCWKSKERSVFVSFKCEVHNVLGCSWNNNYFMCRGLSKIWNMWLQIQMPISHKVSFHPSSFIYALQDIYKSRDWCSCFMFQVPVSSASFQFVIPSKKTGKCSSPPSNHKKSESIFLIFFST